MRTFKFIKDKERFMFLKTITGLVVLTTLTATAQASELDLALSKETAAIELVIDTDRINAKGANINVGGLYNEDDDLLGFIGIASSGGSSTSDKPYSLGVGARVYYATIDNPDINVGAVALGVNGRVKFSVGLPLALTGDFYFAPKITTFSDADDIWDARIRLETSVSENAAAFIGYRKIKVGLENTNSTYNIDDHVQLGVRFHF